MGLFSFIKNAGSKLFNKNKKEAEVKEVELTRAQALQQEIQNLGLPVSNLQVDLGQAVIVHGVTDTNANREKVILALGNVDGVTAVDDRITVTNPEPEAVFYEVVKGDTLSKIAKAPLTSRDPKSPNSSFNATSASRPSLDILKSP